MKPQHLSVGSLSEKEATAANVEFGDEAPTSWAQGFSVPLAPLGGGQRDPKVRVSLSFFNYVPRNEVLVLSQQSLRKKEIVDD